MIYFHCSCPLYRVSGRQQKYFKTHKEARKCAKYKERKQSIGRNADMAQTWELSNMDLKVFKTKILKKPSANGDNMCRKMEKHEQRDRIYKKEA